MSLVFGSMVNVAILACGLQVKRFTSVEWLKRCMTSVVYRTILPSGGWWPFDLWKRIERNYYEQRKAWVWKCRIWTGKFDVKSKLWMFHINFVQKCQNSRSWKIKVGGKNSKNLVKQFQWSPCTLPDAIAYARTSLHSQCHIVSHGSELKILSFDLNLFFLVFVRDTKLAVFYAIKSSLAASVYLFILDQFWASLPAEQCQQQ